MPRRGRPAGFATADAVTVFPGDERTGVKDPIVHRRPDGGWEAWICCHPLDEPGEEDRMTTAYATSDDGLHWAWHGTVLAPRPGRGMPRGARLTVVLPDGSCAYDGRATKEENFSERTGLARRLRDGRIQSTGGEPVSVARYLDVVPLPGGRLPPVLRVAARGRQPRAAHRARRRSLTAVRHRVRAGVSPERNRARSRPGRGS